MRRWHSPKWFGLGLVAFATIFVLGCADRDADDGDLTDDEKTANDAIRKAEAAMEDIGVEMAFDDLSNLENVRSQLPDPQELQKPATRDKLAEASSAFYVALDAYDVELPPETLVPTAPQAKLATLSESDQALVHLYLGYLTSLDALARLAAAGGDLYEISYPNDLNSGEIYKFEFLVSIDGMSPQEVLALFNAEQRQAVLDALDLLAGAVIAAEGQISQVDHDVYRRSVFFHLERVSELARNLSPEIQAALADFEESITTHLLVEILTEVETRWGFDLQQLPPELAGLL